MTDYNARAFETAMRWFAVLRRWPSPDDHTIQEACRATGVFTETLSRAPSSLKMSLEDGYAAWAGTYGTTPTPLHLVEQPYVWRLLNELPLGTLLDAGCGTGRHAAYATQIGHTVIGVDPSAAMLERAREEVPGADFRDGHLGALPVDDASVDAALCALTLGHLADIEPAIAELARVLRPGGRLCISEIHPSSVLIGGHAILPGSDTVRWIRKFPHSISTYLAVFARHGLRVRGCAELAWDHAAFARPDLPGTTGALREALVGWPAVLVWDVQAAPSE
jgi:SAM-dependent methyltransferase